MQKIKKQSIARGQNVAQNPLAHQLQCKKLCDISLSPAGRLREADQLPHRHPQWITREQFRGKVRAALQGPGRVRRGFKQITELIRANNLVRSISSEHHNNERNGYCHRDFNS